MESLIRALHYAMCFMYDIALIPHENKDSNINLILRVKKLKLRDL